jgi:glycerol uptake facilitator protein
MGKLNWLWVPGYIIAQIAGAMAGALLVWITLYNHYT